MKSQSWNNFTPEQSTIVNFQGGIRGWATTFDVMGSGRVAYNHDNYETLKSTSSIFGAISYELRVSQQHAGWHHGILMYSYHGGAMGTNGIIKRACPPGTYQMLFHLKSFRPLDGPVQHPNSNYITAPISTTHGYAIPGEQKDNIFVVRPYLMSPTNVNNQFNLWSHQAYIEGNNYTGPAFLSGFPISIPEVNTPY